MSINATAPIASPTALNGQETSKINPLLETGKGKGEKHFSFWDVLDIVNPLQHIPVVGNIYRSITGDEISNVARVAGDALYGGVVGAAFGVANAISVHAAGDDIGGVVMAKTGLLNSQETALNKKPESFPDAIPDMPPVPEIAAPKLDNPPVVEIRPSDKNIFGENQPVDKPGAQIAEAMPAAMPTPKELNDIAPGANTVDPSVSKKDVQKNMLEALNKYNMMQNADPKTAVIPNLQTASAETPAVPKNIFALPASGPLNNLAGNTADLPVKKQPTKEYNKLRRY